MIRIACIESNSNKKLTIMEELEKDDYNLLINKIKPLNTLMYELNMINDLRSSFKELNTTLNDFNSNKIKEEVLRSSIKKLIQNYLSLIRSFLDGWEGYLKKNFGKQSKEAENFKNLTAKEYDNNFSYRFTYHLSNFSRHTGFPFHTYRSFYNNCKPEVEVFINKQEFLDNLSYNKKFEEEIDSLAEPKISILQHLMSMNKSLNNIHNGLVQFNINEKGFSLIKQSTYLIKFLNKYKNCNGKIIITDYLGDPRELKENKNLEVNLKYLPARIALQIIKSFFKINKKNIKIFNISGLYGGKSNKSFPYKKGMYIFDGAVSVFQYNAQYIKIESTFLYK